MTDLQTPWSTVVNPDSTESVLNFNNEVLLSEIPVDLANFIVKRINGKEHLVEALKKIGAGYVTDPNELQNIAREALALAGIIEDDCEHHDDDDCGNFEE